MSSSELDSTNPGGRQQSVSDVKFRTIEKSVNKIEGEQIRQWNDIETCKREIAKLLARNAIIQWAIGLAVCIGGAILSGIAVKLFGG